MENALLSILVNGLMAALLCATMIYCWRLNKRIRVLQDSKSELARIIREFDESTQRATQSIAEIHRATNRLSENIQHKIDKANFLATDLELMIEKGNRIMGGSGSGMRGEPAGAASRQANRAHSGARAIDQVARSLAAGRDRESPLASAQGDVSRVTPLNEPQPASAGAAPRRGTRPRSRAEQELVQMLNKDESGR